MIERSTSTGVEVCVFISCCGSSEPHSSLQTWEPSKEGLFTGLWWGKGLTYTHSPRGVCVLGTVKENTNWKCTSACGISIQPWGDWPQGKFSVLLVTGRHPARRHYEWLFHIPFNLQSESLCYKTNNGLIELFLNSRLYLSQANTPTVIINNIVNTHTLTKHYSLLDSVWKECACLNSVWHTLTRLVFLCVLLCLPVHACLFVCQHMGQ